MLSVGGSSSRARSKSRERSRTREVRAPSPVSRAPPPSTRRKQAYESDSEISEEELVPGRRAPPRASGRDRDEYEIETDRRRYAYEDDQEPRRRRQYEEEEYKGSSRYARPSKYEYAPVPATKSRHASFPRDDEHDEYEPPGAFKEYDDREPGARLRGGERQYPVPTAREVPYKKDGMYVQPAKYEYAKPPPDVRYSAKTDSRSIVAERGSTYAVKPSAEIEVERRRHRRDQDEEELMKKYEEAQRKKKVEEELKELRYLKLKEAEEAEARRKYEDDSRYSKKKANDSRKVRYKGETESESESESDDSDEYEYRRRKHSDEDRERARKNRYDDDVISKKYKEIEPKSKRSSRHDSISQPQVTELRPRGESSLTTLKPSESGVRRLSVSAGAGALTLMAPGGGGGTRRPSVSGALPPGSPLLEAYRGTYQSISPMPSPMAMPHHLDDGLSDLEPLDEDDDHIIRPKKISAIRKRVEIYDAEADAKIIGNELKHSKPSAAPLVKVLPPLSDDNMMALRAEYKKHFKSQGKGINVSKHIKVKFTGNIGKIAYATALGRWESEAHWANFWYQAGSSRRELLIESLLGRSNAEIRKIKEAFSDKRYNDSLEKCMETELKKDKFRRAILLALEERRMDEVDPVTKTQVRADVDILYKALTAREGGETAMIDIIIVRSDKHLREVLKEFESKYKANFARQMIVRSQNLVGETLAHILNGVLNRPVRDALLLHQALAETSKDRAELLMSRLIRYHWEPKHLELVKEEYRKRYKTSLVHDIREGFTKGDFGDFCIALCDGATR